MQQIRLKLNERIPGKGIRVGNFSFMFVKVLLVSCDGWLANVMLVLVYN